MTELKHQQAYPCPPTYTDAVGVATQGWEGMSMLEYYAAQALPALIAAHLFNTSYADISRMAFDIAGAMVAESAERFKP